MILKLSIADSGWKAAPDIAMPFEAAHSPRSVRNWITYYVSTMWIHWEVAYTPSARVNRIHWILALNPMNLSNGSDFRDVDRVWWKCARHTAAVAAPTEQLTGCAVGKLWTTAIPVVDELWYLSTYIYRLGLPMVSEHESRPLLHASYQAP